MKISKERLEAEKAFTNCIKAMAYEPTAEILKLVYDLILRGVSSGDIIETLEYLKEASKLK